MKTKEIILEILKSKSSPINFEEINEYLISRGIKSNKTTIYRNLDTLESKGVIKKVVLSGQKQFWEINSVHNLQQHIHMICKDCNQIECQIIPQFELPILTFKTQSVEVNLFGLCQKCVH